MLLKDTLVRGETAQMSSLAGGGDEEAEPGRVAPANSRRRAGTLPAFQEAADLSAQASLVYPLRQALRRTNYRTLTPPDVAGAHVAGMIASSHGGLPGKGQGLQGSPEDDNVDMR